MATNAHRNVSVDITGDPTDLERAYLRAANRAEQLDQELEKYRKRDSDRNKGWFDELDGFAKAGTSLLRGFGGQSSLILAGVVAGFFALGPAAVVAASAITLAFGAALTGIGVLAASESAVVRGEFSEMWQDIKNDIVGISGPIQDTLLGLPDIWRGVVSQFRPHLEDAFAELGPALDVFLEGWSVGFQSLIPAIEPLTQGVKQLFIALGLEGPDTFEAFGNAITTLANTAAQHADMFANMLTGVFQLTEGVAKFIDYISTEWERGMANWEDNLYEISQGGWKVNLEDSTDEFIRLAQTGIEVANSLRNISVSMDGLKVSADALKLSMDTLNGVHISADMAALQYHDALSKLTSITHENMKTLDLNTVSGRINVKALLQMATAANEVIVARAKEGATTNQLTGIYETYRQDMVDVLQQLGLSTRAAEKLTDRYLKIPKEINTNIRADTGGAQRDIDNFIITNSGREIPIHVYNKISQLADGGYIGFPDGGLVRGPGGSRTDSIPARVSRGEYVVNAAATRRNLPLLEAINSGKGVGGMGTTIIYQINTTVAPTANLAAVGSNIVESIQAFEKRSGRSWRSD